MRMTFKATFLLAGAMMALVGFASTARADSVHALRFFEDLDEHRLSRMISIDFGELSHLGYFRKEHTDNGKHLGFFRGNGKPISFSGGRTGEEMEAIVAGLGQNPLPGSLSVNNGSSVTPNPEPTTMLLLASGLAGVAVKFRRRRRN